MSSLPPAEVVPGSLPKELGRYRVEAPLGSGGMAIVYRAWDPLLNLYRAIKVLDREAAAHPMLRQRFLTEASTLTRLVHPNVLRIYDVGEDGARCWYAMDLVEEGALQKRIENEGPLPVAEAMRVVFQILQALGAAHRCGIIHRDVKPANVLMRGDGTVMLGDFGSARQAINMALTRTGDVLGTVGYMAPEQRMDSRGAGPAADIYAVGATLFGLVTGRAPLGLFEGEIDSGPLAKLHPEVREIIRNATRYKPEHRYPSARHMAIEIARAWDKITGAQGTEAARTRWIARFDLLIEAVVPASQPPAAGTPSEPSLRNAQPVPRAPERTRSAKGASPRESKPPPPAAPPAGALVGASFVAPLRRLWLSLRDAIDRFFVRAEAPVQRDALGVWEGRVAEMLPLRIEIETQDSDRVQGWSVTTGMRGESVTRVEGSYHPDTGAIDLEEISDRSDRGRYVGVIRDGRLKGEFHPFDRSGRPMSFTLVKGRR